MWCDHPLAARLGVPARQRVGRGRQDIGAAIPDKARSQVDDGRLQERLDLRRKNAGADRMVLEQAFLIGEAADHDARAQVLGISHQVAPERAVQRGFILGGGEQPDRALARCCPGLAQGGALGRRRRGRTARLAIRRDQAAVPGLLDRA
jgi:hypothetical protein